MPKKLTEIAERELVKYIGSDVSYFHHEVKDSRFRVGELSYHYPNFQVYNPKSEKRHDIGAGDIIRIKTPEGCFTFKYVSKI